MVKLLAVVSLFVVNYSAVFSMVFLSNSGQTTVIAQCSPEVKFVASDAFEGDQIQFGWAVSIDGNNALIGAHMDDDLGYRSGSVYIISEVSPGNWTQVAKIVASDGVAEDFFGHALAISGNNALVASRLDDAMGTDSGAAYIFSEVSPGTWVQVAILVPSDGAAYDWFGEAVAIDGTNALIGARGDDELGSSSGSAYIFSEVSPGTWVQVAKLVASDGVMLDEFGRAVAIDGTNALIGAPGDNALGTYSGAAYIFSEVSPGTWIQVAILVASDGAAYDNSGYAVAIDGTNALCGAYWDDDLGEDSGSAYIFSELSAGTWTQIAKLVASDVEEGDRFGQAVAIEGTNAFITAPRDGDLGYHSGCVYFFSEQSPGTWVQVDIIRASDGESSAYFGHDVSISGATVLVGSQYAEAGYIYDVVDDCPGNACEHGSTCIDALYGDYCCVCPIAYGGEFCTDCLCENGGVCKDDPLGIGYCDCSDLHYSGNTCQKSCNNGVSETYPDTGCNCTLSGATGKFCTEDVDDCLSSPCANGGTCSDYGADFFPNHYNEFNCSCEGTGYHGATCEISDCASSPCLNNGMCEQAYDVDGPIGIQCNCSREYEGDWCQTEVDECASSPCVNDGACTDLLGDFACDCTGTGYEGLTCDMDADDCASSPCDNDGVCQDKGANKFKCTCGEFWEGSTCSDDVDDCILKGYYCENGAACTDDSVNMGDVLCDCSMIGFTGKYCNIPLDDNTCDLYNPCKNGGYCESNDESLSCDCAGTGYTGDYCDIFSFNSDCLSSPCLHQGKCVDDETSDYTCDCTDTGYHGDNCEIEYCSNVICENGGTCMEDICTCTSDFIGEYCETDVMDDFAANNRSSSSSSSSFIVSFEESVSYEIQVDCGSTGKQEIVMIGMAGVSGMAILNWLVLREFPFFKNGIKDSPSTSQRLFFMMLFVMTLFDFITDVGFVDYVSNACESDLDDVDVFASVAGTVLGVSSAANMLVLLFLTSRDETKSFQKHLSKHTVMTCFAMLVACANMSAILLLDSNLVGLRALTGGFPDALKNKIKLYGMGTGLLQNLPQLITQGTFILQGGPSNAATIPSVSFSGILMLITIVRVSMLGCDMLQNSTKKKEEAYSMPR